jgi:hypothetical protein
MIERLSKNINPDENPDEKILTFRELNPDLPRKSKSR